MCSAGDGPVGKFMLQASIRADARGARSAIEKEKYTAGKVMHGL
jgi:hypothetical protein